jgi:hypothetical protein
MVTELFTPIVSGVSVIVGGLVALLGVGLTNKGNTERLRQQLRHDAAHAHARLARERGEELYQHTDKWLLHLASGYLAWLRVMQGKLTYGQAQQLELERGLGTHDFGRIEVLVDIYFPSARQSYDTMIGVRGQLNATLTAYQHECESSRNDGRPFTGRYIECQEMIEAAGRQFKAAIIEGIRSL